MASRKLQPAVHPGYWENIRTLGKQKCSLCVHFGNDELLAVVC